MVDRRPSFDLWIALGRRAALGWTACRSDRRRATGCQPSNDAADDGQATCSRWSRSRRPCDGRHSAVRDRPARAVELAAVDLGRSPVAD